MNTNIFIKRRRVEGFALLMTLVMVAISLIVLTATMRRTATDSDLNARNGQYSVGLYAAESATERIIARMQWDFMNGGDSYVTNNLNLYRTGVPLGSETAYWDNFQFSDARGNLNKTYVECLSARIWAPVQSQFSGLNGWGTVYRLVSNVQQTNGRFSLTNAVQEDVELDSIPIFQFAIFYNHLLEFTWCAPMTVNGRTHANDNIFVGSSADLSFNSTVTTTGGIYKTNWDGHAVGTMGGAVDYNGNPGYSTNFTTLQLPIGTNNSAATVRELILIPPAGEDPNSPLGQQRYYNKAQVLVMVSNTTVTTTLRTSIGDPAPTVITAYYSTNDYSGIVTNFPFLSVSNTFTDQRELSKKVKAVQLDVDSLRLWMPVNRWITNKFPVANGIYPNIFYVADNRTYTSTQLPAVRLRNGSILPANATASGANTGWTLATPNPLYVWGNYNLGPGGVAGTTDTSKTFPASVVSDALTVLSQSWSDAASAGAYTSRTPSPTTINAAIITGTVYSTGPDNAHFSGGVHNLPRLLEAWNTGTILTLNTSIVNLFDSLKATNQFVNPGTYYSAPTRQFSFDNNFTNSTKLPPGTPCICQLVRAKWRVPPPHSVTYAGN
jgi:hypothetical protein